MTAPDPVLEKMLQYTHLEKLYGYLPGLEAALPGIFGLGADEYAAIRRRFDREAESAARALLAEPGIRGLVGGLPFGTGARVLTVGDSITDDLASWAEILRHLLSLGRPDDAVTVTNSGLSAHTTAMVLRRWPAMLTARPDWILCALGGNDVTRIDGGKQQVSTAESVANLAELRRIAGTEVHWVWLTPVPVDEDRIAAHPPFRFGRSSWQNKDIVALADALADAMGGREEPVVDLVAAFGVPPQKELQGPDGVHPTVAGQQRITDAVLRTLAAP